MAKIIRLIDHMEKYPDAAQFLIDTARIFEGEGIETVLIAGKSKDGQVMTGYFNCDFGERQELCGHVQCDIIDQMILANLDRY